MTNEDFIEILQQRDLVSSSIARQLRAKIETGDRRITPQSLLKFLVKKDFVTQQQAKQLLETTLTVTPSAESSILGMSAMPTPPAASEVPTQPLEEIPTLTPIDDEISVDQDAQAGQTNRVDDNPQNLVTDEGSFVAADLFGKQPSSLISESLSKVGVGDSMLSEAIAASGRESDPPEQQRHKKEGRQRRGQKNEWDSSLLLLGGGGLILLIVAGVIVGYLLGRENADAVLAEAGSFFDGGSYTQAIKQYERFVENHPQHPEISAARVKLGMARLWKASSGTSDFTEALSTSEQVFSEIEDESEFSSAQDELASLLPRIAQGLANQAEQASDPALIQELLKKANTALSLCANTKYIPTGFRDKVLMSEITQTLQRVERSRAQNLALEGALTDMQAAIDRHDTSIAYQIFDSVLDEHPGLVNSEPLAAKLLEISAAESAVVKYVPQSEAASREPRPSDVVAELALANRRGPVATGAAGVIAVRVDGAIYGVNAQDGSLHWRHHVGIAPHQAPVVLPSGDLLVVDAVHHELQKLASKTGALQWRQVFETSVTRPVLLGERVLIAESAGRLHVVDIASGERQGYVQFAQQLPTPPAVDAQSKRIYISGEHSSLYTISSEDFSCLGVYFLNHAKGSVTTAPTIVLNKVIVAVAKGLSTSSLEVLELTDSGIPHRRATARRLEGLINTPLITAGRRLVALTSQGQIDVYEVGSGSSDDALTTIASRESESGTPLARFGSLSQGHLWVGGRQLIKLAILPTSDRLSVSTIDRDYLGDTFDHPLQIRGDWLIHVRRPASQAGAVVAAMELKSGRPVWETELAVPPAGSPAADTAGMQICAIAATGSAFLVNREAMRQRVLNRAEQITPRRELPPLNQCLDLGLGRLVAAADRQRRLLHFRPGLPRGALQTIELAGPLCCTPVAWDDGFVAPTETGQVFLYESDDGQPWGSPFQPPLTPGSSYSWNPPAVYGSGTDSQLVLSDGRDKVYLLNRMTTPQPHLKATTELTLSSPPINTRFAVLGDLAIAGTAAGELAVLELPSLVARPATQLGAHVTWGPFTAGQHVVFATENDELVCLDSQAQLVWREPLAHGAPTGQPITLESTAVVLWQQGGLSRISLSNGNEAAYVALPQPAVAGPVAFGQRLVVSSYDGTLLIVDQP